MSQQQGRVSSDRPCNCVANAYFGFFIFLVLCGLIAGVWFWLS